MNILLVDDEMIAINGLRAAVHWEEIGIHKVYYAFSVQEAKKLLQDMEIHILLCDIEMPMETGFDLLHWIKEEKMEIVSILLTCHADFTYATEGIKNGVMDYLLKPVDIEVLEQVLKKAIGERKRRQDALEILQDRKNTAGSGQRITEQRPPVMTVVDKIKEIVHQNVNQNITREFIGKEIFLNPDYLSKLFKKETGMSLSDYIAEVKIAEAKRLLAFTDKSIGLIATDIGYTNFSYFSKLFRKMTGMSPNQYRQLY